jgi:ankyrin repeat protein
MQQDMDGMLPIHWACAQNAPCSVIEALLRAYPDSINVIDKMSRTPLSILLSSSHTEKDAIVVALNRDISYWTTSLQDEVSNLKTLLAHAESQEQSLREELTELQHRFNQVDIQLDQCIHDKVELQDDNTSLLGQCKEIDGQNKMLQEMNEKLQEKVNELGQVLLLMKKEQNTIRTALINMMGKKKKGGMAAAAVVTCVAQDMKSILSSDENRSGCGEGDLSEEERFAEI